MDLNFKMIFNTDTVKMSEHFFKILVWILLSKFHKRFTATALSLRSSC